MRNYTAPLRFLGNRNRHSMSLLGSDCGPFDCLFLVLSLYYYLYGCSVLHALRAVGLFKDVHHFRREE